MLFGSAAVTIERRRAYHQSENRPHNYRAISRPYRAQRNIQDHDARAGSSIRSSRIVFVEWNQDPHIVTLNNKAFGTVTFV